MSTDTASDTKPKSNMEKALTEEQAKQFGLAFDPENPPTFASVIQSQYANSMNLLKTQQAVTMQQISSARQKIVDKVTNKGKLSPENEAKLAQLSKVMELYPQFIEPIYVYAATMVKWQRENDALMAVFTKDNPTHMLDMLGKIQSELRASVPYAQWPENAGKTPDQIAAELAARNGTQVPPAEPVESPTNATQPL